MCKLYNELSGGLCQFCQLRCRRLWKKPGANSGLSRGKFVSLLILLTAGLATKLLVPNFVRTYTQRWTAPPARLNFRRSGYQLLRTIREDPLNEFAYVVENYF